jgi:divalent metal cation (Fe/Co/Zn/Cd) transporter
MSEVQTGTLPSHDDTAATAERPGRLRRAVRLEYLTVGWNVVEGVVGISAALAAGSVALLGFGIDSFVETSSGLILLWRLGAEARRPAPIDLARIERRAQRLVGLSLFLLAAYVAFEAARSLVLAERPGPTLVGIALTSLSLPVMAWLSRAKRRVARQLGSRAMESDAFQTTACMWLSIFTLAGLGLNGLFGWWWADPLAGLAMTYFIVEEGREAWRGEECGCH